jgi:hypothetical protein
MGVQGSERARVHPSVVRPRSSGGVAEPWQTAKTVADERAPSVVRVVLAVYAAPVAVTGLWAAAFPRSFYDDFPGFGLIWVAVDGPYNEHLTRDVGTLNLALAVLVASTAVVGTWRLVVIASAAALVNAVPHLVYHLANLEGYETSDAVSSVTTLIAAVLVPAAVLGWLVRSRPR